MSDEINYPTGFDLKDIVSWGNTGLICLDRSSKTVVKSPHEENNQDDIAIERTIYERCRQHGGHEGVLNYYGPYESGIRLEFACNGDLRSFLQGRSDDINIERRLRWGKQIADALRFVHSIDVVHGDVTCGNILLDEHLNIKLSDFGGSSFDGSPLRVEVTVSHRSPGPALSIQGDIFALGSTLYEVMAGHVPYHDLPEAEIKARYSKLEFPETKSLGSMGDVITHCWHGRYGSFEAIIADITAIQQREFPSTSAVTVSLQNSTLITFTAIGVVAVLLGARLAHRWNWLQ